MIFISEFEVIHARAATYLSQGDDALLRAHAASLDHDEVVVHFAVVGETAHRCDGFLRKIVLGGSVVLDDLSEKRNVVSKLGVHNNHT